jgi:hypothetical protein
MCRVPQECPQGVVDLYQMCLNKLPSGRPSAMEVMERLEVLKDISLTQNALSF